MTKQDKYRPLVLAGAVVAMLVGLGTLGLTMPWDAVARQELDAVEAKSDACCSTCEKGISEINGKLDILIRHSRRGEHDVRRPR